MSDAALANAMIQREATSSQPGAPGGNGHQPGADTREDYHLTDLGNARRLVTLHGADLRHVATWGAWLVWDGKRWAKDETAEVYRRAKDTVAAIYAEAGQIADGDLRKTLAGWALRSESEAKVSAMVKHAESEPEIAIRADAFDRGPWLLNVLNGTLDLRTGQLREHRRQDLITKLAPVEYGPQTRSELWDRFIADATGGGELANFLARAVGYSLTGDTREKCLFFVHGPRNTGKTTFIEAIKVTLGDYARTSDFEAFLARKEVGGPRNDIARLEGARLVASAEVDKGRRLAEGLVKLITGGDTISARYLFRESREFRPAFKLWLVANDAPRVRDDDDALWDRIFRIPFTREVPRERRDPNLALTLRDAGLCGAAILAWAVRGVLEWQRYGLNVPKQVADATAALRDAMDPLTDFLTECCVLEPNAFGVGAALWGRYKAWIQEQAGRIQLGRKEFSQRLAKRFPQDRRGAERERGFLGIRLRQTGDKDPDDSPQDRGKQPDEVSVAESADTCSKGEVGNFLRNSNHARNLPTQVSEVSVTVSEPNLEHKCPPDTDTSSEQPPQVSVTSPGNRLIGWGLDHGWPELRLDVCRTIAPGMSAYAAFAKAASPEDFPLALRAIEAADA